MYRNFYCFILIKEEEKEGEETRWCSEQFTDDIFSQRKNDVTNLSIPAGKKKKTGK